MNEEINILLAHYFSGEATEKELQTLDHWLAQSVENEKQFQKMTLLYQVVGQKGAISDIDTEKALAQFQSHIHKNQIGISGRGNVCAALTKRTVSVWRIAATITILLMGVFAAFYFTNNVSKGIHLTAIGAAKEYELFENANVTLSQGAEIIINKKNKNEVQLKGEATFIIHSERNSSTQLVVQAGETFIKDIGTVFTVDATEPEQRITVDVSEGEVWFYTHNDAGVYVKACESATYDVQTKQFTVWKTRALPQTTPMSLPEIVFHNIPLNEIITELQHRFGVEIQIHPKTLNSVHLNASFDSNESLENILEIIAATVGAELLLKDGVYVVRN